MDGWEYICIWAKKSWGKTTAAMTFLSAFYRARVRDGDGWRWMPEGSPEWDTVFRHIAFTLPQFLELITSYKTGKCPLALWDDAAVYMGKYEWTDPVVQEFSEFFVGIRTYLNNLIVTAPKPGQIVKGIREDYTKKIQIVEPIWENGKAKFWYQDLLWRDNFYAAGTYVRKVWREEGTIGPLPDHAYERYNKLRKRFLGEQKLERLMTKLRQASEKELNEWDWEVINYMGAQYKLTTRQYRHGGNWEEHKGCFLKLESLGILAKSEDGSTIRITPLGERLYREGPPEEKDKD